MGTFVIGSIDQLLPGSIGCVKLAEGFPSRPGMNDYAHIGTMLVKLCSILHLIEIISLLVFI